VISSALPITSAVALVRQATGLMAALATSGIQSGSCHNATEALEAIHGASPGYAHLASVDLATSGHRQRSVSGASS
jgi:hypothetical protein